MKEIMSSIKHWFKEYYIFNKFCNKYSFPLMLIVTLVNLLHSIFYKENLLIILIGLFCSLRWFILNLLEFKKYRKNGFFE